MSFVGVIVAMYLLGLYTCLVLPSIATDLVLASLALFGVAHLVLCKLHLPSRYVLYALPVAALLIIAAHSQATLSALRMRWLGLQRVSHRCTSQNGRSGYPCIV